MSTAERKPSGTEQHAPRRWKVNAGQVRTARLRVLRDRDRGQQTPAYITRVAAIQIPEDDRRA